MTLLHTRRQTEGGIRGRRIRLDYNHLAIATFLFFSFLFNFDLPLNLSHLLISFYYCVIFWYCLSGSWFVDEICESSQWIRIRLEWPMLNDGCNKLGTEEFSGQFPFSYLFSPLFFFFFPSGILSPLDTSCMYPLSYSPLGNWSITTQDKGDRTRDLTWCDAMWCAGGICQKLLYPFISFDWYIQYAKLAMRLLPSQLHFFLLFLFIFSLSWYPLVQGFNLHC